MRCVYKPDIQKDLEIVMIGGDQAKHLLKVVRIKLGEQLLLNSGKGFGLKGEVTELDKKSVTVKVNEVIDKNLIERSIALCTVKKEALELSIRQSTELGINRIYLLKSQFSQDLSIKQDRIEKIIVSAMEQSNNFYFPKIVMKDFNNFVEENCSQILFFTSQTSTLNKSKITDKMIPLIGPEGGFSDDELDFLNKSVENHVHLPTPILRASTAVSTCIGYLLGANS